MSSGDKLDISNLRPVYLSLQILGGHICLPFLIFTWVNPYKASARHPTLISFSFTWTLNSIVYCLTLYTGRPLNPVDRLCFAQSILIHGAAPMAAVAGLTVVVQLWRALQNPSQPSALPGRAVEASMVLIIAIPYITFLGFIVASLVIALNNPSYVNVSNGIYCTLSYKPFQQFGVPLFTTLIVAIILVFEAAISARYYFLWQHISRVFPMADRKQSLSMCLRVLIFNVYSVITLGASISFLLGYHGPWPYMVQASLPLVAFLVFGTQMDVFRAWCWWKPTPKLSSSNESFPIPSGHSSRQLISETDSPI